MADENYARLGCKDCAAPLTHAAIACRRWRCSQCADTRRSPACFVCEGCHRVSARRVRGGSADAGRFCSRGCAFRQKGLVHREITAIKRIAVACRASDRASRAKAGAIERAAAHALTLLKPCMVCGEQFRAEHGREATCGEACRRIARKRADRANPNTARGRRIARKRYKMRLRTAVVENFDDLEILERDGWQCQICGVATPRELRGSYEPTAPEVDHILALANGGPHSRLNVQCACRSCNGAKGASLNGSGGVVF